MRHRAIPVPSPWSVFLAWPGGASVLYLVSAACLLGGVGMILAPAAGLEDRIAERLAMVGTVLTYTGALLGVACLVCHWRRDHDDAVALSVLLALFLVANVAPLAVLTHQETWLVACLALVSLAGGLACAWIWQRSVGRPLPLPVQVGGGLLLVGTAIHPVLISLGVKWATKPVPGELLAWWQAGQVVLGLGMLVLWIGGVLQTSSSDWPRTSRIRSRNLPWILALVVAAAAAIQSWLVSYTACLGFSAARAAQSSAFTRRWTREGPRRAMSTSRLP